MPPGSVIKSLNLSSPDAKQIATNGDAPRFVRPITSNASRLVEEIIAGVYRLLQNSRLSSG